MSDLPAVGRHQRLSDDLTAENPLAGALIRALAAEQVQFQALDIEQGQKVSNRVGHAWSPNRVISS